MKKHTIALALGLCTLVGSSAGCSTVGDQAATEPQQQTAVAAQEIITSPLGANVLAWPMGPIAWDGLTGTWPIAVWSSLPISLLAFDVAGVSNLSLSISTLDGLGSPLLLDGVTALPISTAFLGGIQAGLATPWAGGVFAPTLGLGGLWAPGAGFDGTFAPWGLGSFGFGGFDTTLGATSSALVGGALGVGGISPFLTPAITSNALMFTSLPLLTSVSPFLINVGFTGVDGLNTLMMGGLSMFASTAASNVLLSGTFPFTSLAFPIMGVGPLATPLLL